MQHISSSDYYEREDVLQPLGDTYFKRFVLYKLDMELALEKFKVASGPYGGPVAFFFPQSTSSDGRSSPAMLQIMSASGQLLTEMIWPNGSVSDMGWTDDDQLVFMQENGFVFVYSCLGPHCATRPVLREKFSIGSDPEKLGVLGSRLFANRQGTGIAVMAGNYRIYCVNTYSDNARLFRLPEIHGMNSPPSCWTVFAKDDETMALVGRGSDVILVSNKGDVTALNLDQAPPAPFAAIEVSLNRNMMALYTESGHLWIGSINGRYHKDLKVSNRKRRLTQMMWCTNAAVMLSWSDAGGQLVSLVSVNCGDGDESIDYYYDSAAWLFQERDGVRVLWSQAHEMVQEVPQVLCDILLFSSVDHPGSNLYTAADRLANNNPEAHEYLNQVRPRMEEAVEQCLSGAGHSWSVRHQKQMLQAASIGKSFLFNYTKDTFHSMTRTLRVLNSLRRPEIGMPLTFAQFDRLGLKRLIDRLIARGHYPLVARICEFMDLPDAEGMNRMLEHWALVKLHSSSDEHEVANAIIAKFGARSGISYAEIASKAMDIKKQIVAERLLDCETRINKQVPLLLKMGLFESALARAVKSGDSELIHMVLQHLLKELKSNEFHRVIQKSPVALSLYLDSCQADMQLAIHEREDNFLAQARLLQKELFLSDQMAHREMLLTQVEDLYRKGLSEFGAHETRDAKLLIVRQREISTQFPQIDVSNCSLDTTLRRLGGAGKMKLFEAMRKEFNVSEKRYWWLLIDIYSSIKDWAALEKFARSKRSPVGYEPFFAACLKQGSPGEAEKYLTRMDTDAHVRSLFKLGRLDQAIALAVQRNSEDGFRYLECHTTGADRAKVLEECKKLEQ